MNIVMNSKVFMVLFAFLLVIQQPAIQDADQSQREQRDQLWESAENAEASGDHSKTAELVEQVLAIEKDWLGENDAELIGSMTWLAEIYEHLDELDKAKSQRKAALDLSATINGSCLLYTSDAADE